jgi:hypothetical protein
MEKHWWEKPMRVIQYNLQVADTQLMQPEKIAQDLVDSCANAVVINVGGIYAWYESKIKHHHVNEFLPKDGDLLQEILDACHEKNIKVIARFDFSKTDDIVYLSRPEWFVQQRDKSPLIYGKERMGNWSLLMSTCINGGYRNEEVAVPVMEEVLTNYDIDGIFFNAPHPSDCYCERCKRKYMEYYGEQLPDDPKDFKEDWHSRCLKDNIGVIYKAVKNIRQDVPVILYYHGYDLVFGTEGLVDDLDERYATADMICTEAQNVLSRGVKDMQPIWKPLLNMKIGNAVPGYPKPFGIIHSCPGMDWRHAGLPKSEYMFWMSQVMANNAHLWHSITGFNDTVTDKRLLSAVKEINEMVSCCEDEMSDAVSSSQVLLLWDASRSASGWVDGMANMQYQFDLMDIHHIDVDRMRLYPVVVVPDGFKLSEKTLVCLKEYVECGGNLIVEKSSAESVEAVCDLLGVNRDVTESVELVASYLRIETDDAEIRKGFTDITFIPLRKQVLYMKAHEETEVLMTLVPPFAPLDAVGAPPERASMPVSQTDIPMLMVNKSNKGKVMTLAFSLSNLILDYHLEDHYWLMRNCLDYMCGSSKEFNMSENIAGLLASVFKSDDKVLVHLINGIGQRPLVGSIPYYNAEFTIKLPEGKTVKKVKAVIEDQPVAYRQEGNMVTVCLSKLSVWNMISIETV